MSEVNQSNNTSDNNKRIAKNALYMYGRMIVMLFISLFTARITFRVLGVENYGLYNVVGSVIVFFSFINQALVTATRRYITAEIAVGTDESRQNVFSLALISHIFISVIIVIFAETIGLWAVNSFLNLPDNRMFAANVVYQLSVISAVVGILQAPYSAAITSHEKMSIYAYFSIVEVILKLIAVAVLYFLPGDKLIVYAVTTLVASVAIRMMYSIYCKRYFKECTYRKPHNMDLLKEMFNFMGWSLFGQGVVVLTDQGVTILINMFFTVAANAAMGISNQITNIVNGFVLNFQVAFQPQITKLFIKRDFKEMVNLTIRSSRLSSYLVMFFMVPIFFQVQNFLSMWLGDYPEFAVEFCIYTLIAIHIDGMAAPLWMILYSDSKLKSYQIGSSLVFSLNFLLGWLFLYMGFPPYSVIIVRILVYFIAVAYRLYMVKDKVGSFPIFRWINEVVLSSIYIMTPPCLIMYAIKFIQYNNIWADFIVNCSICAILIVLSIYLIGLTKNERAFVNSKVMKNIKKVNI